MEIDDLKKQLQERIEALNKLHQQETERIQKEISERNVLAEVERQEKIELHRKREEEIRQKRIQDAADAAERKRQEELIQKQKEEELSQAQRAKEEYEAKLRWISEEISRQERIEEIRHQEEEDAKNREVGNDVVLPNMVNTEHPEAPVNKEKPGDAVSDTDGIEVGPSMSNHLRQILRQAQRQ